jgi:hypothetical protein
VNCNSRGDCPKYPLAYKMARRLFLIYGLSEQLRFILMHSGAALPHAPAEMAGSHQGCHSRRDQCLQR